MANPRNIGLGRSEAAGSQVKGKPSRIVILSRGDSIAR